MSQQLYQIKCRMKHSAVIVSVKISIVNLFCLTFETISSYKKIIKLKMIIKFIKFEIHNYASACSVTMFLCVLIGVLNSVTEQW